MDTLIEESPTTIRNSFAQRSQSDIAIILTEHNNLTNLPLSLPGSRRMTGETAEMLDLIVSRRPSGIMQSLKPPVHMLAQKRLMLDMFHTGSGTGSKVSLNIPPSSRKEGSLREEQIIKNRRMGNDSLSTIISALYAKFIVVLGLAFPVTEILSYEAPPSFYQGFYLYLYLGSVAFVLFMYSSHLRTNAAFSMLDTYNKRQGSNLGMKKRITRYGSFYLRVGAVAFGIGSMVYSGLEFGQYFELKKDENCQNILIALTPAVRMLLSIVQMQFIFLNTKEFEMGNHKVIARFGLMHMVATNLCEWLYVIIEETKHEIIHITQVGNTIHSVSPNVSQVIFHHNITKRATASEIVVECRRTNIMGSLVQRASAFLFPCTIEYSLICAVILFEMWKQIRSIPDIIRSRRNSMKPLMHQNSHQLSVDCSNAHRGMFSGILVIVLTIISLIMYFVLSEQEMYKTSAVIEVTITEMILYTLTALAILIAMIKMKDLKYSKKSDVAIGLDCTLLLLAQSGIYIYNMFSIMGSYFTMKNPEVDNYGSEYALAAEIFNLLQTTLQTIFILNAWWRRCKGAQQNHNKPGREVITFLLISNMAIWFISTLIKSRASFRPTHLEFFGAWAWTVITHISMPLAIFYRLHSTICLFEIWKTTYKARREEC